MHMQYQKCSRDSYDFRGGTLCARGADRSANYSKIHASNIREESQRKTVSPNMLMNSMCPVHCRNRNVSLSVQYQIQRHSTKNLFKLHDD